MCIKNLLLFVRCGHPFDSFILGIEVNIYADSTFRYESCSSMATGRWRVKQDSLILTTESNIVKKDSSHLQQGRFVYAIETNGELHRILKPKRKTLRDYLVKADPGTIEK